MFAKLLKYEWKATGGLLGILSAAALGVALAAALTMKYLVRLMENAMSANDASFALMTPMMILLFFLILAIVAYVVVVQILLLHRFYKHKFTDEGYLTFTLPVSAHQIFLSSLSNMLIWSLISMAVVAVSVLLIMLIGLPEPITSTMPDSDIFLDQDAAYWILSFIRQPVAWVSGYVMVMACITIGAVLAKKHKILTAIGIYYGFSMVTGFATSILSATATMMSYQSVEMMDVYLMMGMEILLQICLGIGAYFLSVFLMKRKLNLP